MTSSGKLIVYTGCMFGGKTARLLSTLQSHVDAGIPVFAARPTIDTRSPASCIQSHNGATFPCATIASSAELLALVRAASSSSDVETAARLTIGIDECQFFDSDIVSVCVRLISEGNSIYIAGLDMDCKGTPFGPMPQLMAVSDDVVKCRDAICYNSSACKFQPAIFSKRRVPPKATLVVAAVAEENVIVIGGHDVYVPSCRDCFQL